LKENISALSLYLMFSAVNRISTPKQTGYKQGFFTAEPQSKRVYAKN